MADNIVCHYQGSFKRISFTKYIIRYRPSGTVFQNDFGRGLYFPS